MTFGVIGYGRFGQLWANALAAFGEVFIYDKNPITTNSLNQNKKIKITNLNQAAMADIVFILTPISEFAESCASIKSHLRSDTIVVDCCSVKVYPAKIMQNTFLSQQTLVATHPLFGPDSIKKTGVLSGHKIVVCPLQGNDDKYHSLISIFKNLGLQVVITTPEDHDKQMASSQALVHFIGRGLSSLNLQEQELATPDFLALLNINKMVVNDSWQLFLDMHTYNPFTNEIRNKLIAELKKIANKIDL